MAAPFPKRTWIRSDLWNILSRLAETSSCETADSRRLEESVGSDKISVDNYKTTTTPNFLNGELQNRKDIHTSYLDTFIPTLLYTMKRN